MIAMQTFAHHMGQPAHYSRGVQVAPKSNWVLGGPRQVTVFIALPMPVSGQSDWKAVLTLHFPWNEATLTQKQEQELRLLPKNADYRVLGYASRPGSAPYNYRLGLQRAQAVAQVLEQAGTKVPVRVLSWGNVFSSSNPAEYAQDQKAVVAQADSALP